MGLEDREVSLNSSRSRWRVGNTWITNLLPNTSSQIRPRSQMSYDSILSQFNVIIAGAARHLGGAARSISGAAKLKHIPAALAIGPKVPGVVGLAGSLRQDQLLDPLADFQHRAIFFVRQSSGVLV